MKKLAAVMIAVALVSGVAYAKLDPNAPGRTAEERDRDASNKPDDLYAYWGIKAGDTVVDFIPGDGYNTYLLSQLVGPKGKVYAIGTYNFDKLDARLKANPLANVEHMKSDGLASLKEGSVDAVITIRNFHDIPEDQLAKVLDNVKKALKPAGVFGVVDARTDKGRDKDQHRIADDVIKTEATKAGFKLAGSSEMLANKADDHKNPNWEKRYTLDQSCFKFTK
ncbi:MAG: class I SAM-dependent methyltransferase [Acidobacteria bacterium]|nr:class I SAM-dependent methyltransferase [Acidobacteriota bacterium]